MILLIIIPENGTWRHGHLSALPLQCAHLARPRPGRQSLRPRTDAYRSAARHSNKGVVAFGSLAVTLFINATLALVYCHSLIGSSAELSGGSEIAYTRQKRTLRRPGRGGSDVMKGRGLPLFQRASSHRMRVECWAITIF